MGGKNEKLEMVSLAWCESVKGLKREEGRRREGALNIDKTFGNF